MISRRILRIKILQLLYAYFQGADSSINKYEKELFFSIQKTYDLYHYLLLLIIDIADYANSRIDIARQKMIPTREDLNPNTKFVENSIIKQLRVNRQFNQYLNSNKLSWVNSPELIKKLHNRIRMTSYFKEYMEKPDRNYEQDKKLIIDIFTTEIVDAEGIYQTLEEQSIYWNDEVEFVISMIAKTIKDFHEDQNEDAPLMSLFKNDDDREFARDLFRKSVVHKEEYTKLIESYTENWDVERIAFLDMLILVMAITEAIAFTSIPTRVTINEYLEIAKFYSTEKSSVFINGLLDKIFKYLKDNNQIVKTGRGLIGE
ncbi:MAG TPA: transcription antitermination factor NusB [Bacteroidales bacterium]|jgi:N utilization substance protein B|nr:transcription antitermination factor NusB [Bacteroidales bacterium]